MMLILEMKIRTSRGVGLKIRTHADKWGGVKKYGHQFANVLHEWPLNDLKLSLNGEGNKV